MLCLYCANTIDSYPCQLPRYINNKGIKFLPGHYCSWNCVKAKAFESRLPVLSLIRSLAWFTSFKPSHCPGNHNPDCPCLSLRFQIDLPLPRINLDLFGGQLSSAEYRNGFMKVKNEDDWKLAFVNYDSEVIQIKQMPRQMIRPQFPLAQPRYLQPSKPKPQSILQLIESNRR
jgi:hypothetical protein